MRKSETEDQIEELIIKSVRLGEKARKRRERGISSSEERLKIEEMESETERLWEEACELGKDYVQTRNYENLANAILKSAIEDYEALISGDLSEGPEGVSTYEIEGLMQEQIFVHLDMEALLKQIRDIYENRFIPYAQAHKSEIFADWKQFNKQGLTIEDRIKATKHRCPMCGGALRPGYAKICCTTCYLSVFIPGFNTLK